MDEPRLYGELAGWWPLLSPHEGYLEEATYFGRVLTGATAPVRDVLELGSGGGHNAFYLRALFSMTLVDRSPEMLAVSERLNPGCTHRRGDLRRVRLGRSFDAVFVHDAISYVTTGADLDLAAETAFVHCRPGGVALFVPDFVAETFAPFTQHGGHDGPDGRAARYLEWVADADPDDTEVEAELVVALREPGRPLRVVNETHRMGLFGRAVWRAVLARAGFEVEAITEETSEDHTPRELFLGRRPA